MKSAEEILRAISSVCPTFPDPACRGVCICHADLAAIRAAQIDAAEWMREEAAKVLDGFGVPNRFTVHDAWRDEYTPSQVYETGAIDTSVWAADAIRSIKLPGGRDMTDTVQSSVPEDHPMMQAWERYKASPEYANSFRWAAQEQHRAGSMWAAFVAGWQATDDALRDALDGIMVYGQDTLSGRADGPDDRAWQREAVREMTSRAIRALATQPSKTETSE